MALGIGAEIEHHDVVGAEGWQAARRAPAGRCPSIVRSDELRHRHQRAGVAGRHRSAGASVLHRGDGETHRAGLGAADRLAGLVVARDAIGGVLNTSDAPASDAMRAERAPSTRPRHRRTETAGPGSAANARAAPSTIVATPPSPPIASMAIRGAFTSRTFRVGEALRPQPRRSRARCNGRRHCTGCAGASARRSSGIPGTPRR